MNKTKKITQGAMLLAILGALIIIDRITSFFFSEFLVLIAPVIIIMYSAMYDAKQGILLSVGILIVTFLIANLNILYMIYIPVGIITGICYAIALKKNANTRKLLIIAIVTYVIGEVIASFVVYPILGYKISDMILQSKETLTQVTSMYGMNADEVLGSLKFDFNNLLVIVYIVTTLLVGAMEGIIIHLISVFLLKRFRIMDLGKISLWDFKPSPVLTYTCMAGLMSVIVNRFIDNEIFYYASAIMGILGGAILLYFGYIFLVLYGTIILHRRNFGMLIFVIGFIFPAMLMMMIILGFLYGSGPLRTFLENKAKPQL